MHQTTYLPNYLPSFCLYIHLSVRLSIYLPVCSHIYPSIHLSTFFSENFSRQRYKATLNELRLPALTRPLGFPGQHCKVPVARALQPPQVKYGQSEAEADFPRDMLTILWCNFQSSVCDEGNSHTGSEFLLLSCLAYSSILKMEEIYSSEMLDSPLQPRRRTPFACRFSHFLTHSWTYFSCWCHPVNFIHSLYELAGRRLI
jgi:hypothetical protein